METLGTPEDVVHVGTLSREGNLPVSFFVFLLILGRLLKVKICSSRSKFFPLGVDSLWEALSQAISRKSQELFPFIRVAEKCEDIPIHLNQLL